MNTPSISIESLLVLDAIAERGSYASAAEYLNKVPSALSYIVQKLEEQLDVTLFQRQGRRSVLTPAGKYLLEEGRHILLAINKISEQTKTIANGWEPKIRIAIDSIIDINKVLPAFKEFLDDHKNVELDIQEEVLNGTWEALIDDEVDLLIGASAPVPIQKGIRAIPLDVIHMLFCVSKSHALAKIKTPIAQAELINYRTIIVHDSAKSIVTKTTAGFIEQSEHLYVSTLEQKIKAITAGLGGGFLPIERIQYLLDAGELVVVPLQESLQETQLYIAWKILNKGKGLASLVSHLNVN
jgi:DNA-binding transcriptional LysR family regulator